MCNSFTLAKWQEQAILKVLELEGVQLELIINNKGFAESKSGKVLKHLNFKNFFWTIYMFLIRNRFRSSKKRDMSSVFNGIAKLECEVTKKGKFSEHFSESDLSAVREHNLDFILRFGFGIIRGEILEIPKYGVWSFHHDDETKYRGGPPGFWSIYHNDKVSGSILQRLTDKLDGGIILKKGYLKTKYSYIKNRDQIYLESARWPALLVKNILNGHVDIFKNPVSETKAKIFYAPTNIQFLKFLFYSKFWGIKEVLKLLFFVDYWNIGVVKNDISSFLNDEKQEVIWYPLRTKKKFLADPFAFVDPNDSQKINICFERYDYAVRKGFIEFTCFEEGHFSAPQSVLEVSNHLSYPYLIKEDKAQYMIPENHESNAVSIYKADNSLHQWSKQQILINDFAGVDNTVIKRDGVYWMFTSNKNDGVRHNLYVFYSDNLHGEWIAHAQNPVKTDVRAARSAGTPFEFEGDLYRPSMDYSEKIEGRIIINKVVKLSKMEYEEVSFKVVNPFRNSAFPDKIHTLCAAGDFTLIDGAKEAFIFSNWNFFKHKSATILEKLGVRKKGG